MSITRLPWIVTPLTSQLDDLTSSIKRAMRQAKMGLEIQRNSIAAQAGQYDNQIGNSPEQERVLTQIGRQQEVKSGLYLMLLQKREENSISLAATADKGKMIDAPSLVGKVSPKSSIIMLIAFVLGIAIPAVILFLIEFFKYKIEGHDDVVKLTNIPIIADIPMASDAAKKQGKADIVVHQNVNNLPWTAYQYPVLAQGWSKGTDVYLFYLWRRQDLRGIQCCYLARLARQKGSHGRSRYP